MLGTATTSDGLSPLRNNANLRHFVTQDVPAGPGLSVIREWPQLETLVVVRGDVRDEDLLVLETCRQLRHLNLNHNLETRHCGELLGKLTSLQLLSLTGSGVDETVLPDLMRLPELKQLLLNQTSVTRLSISEAGDFPSLETLDLRATPLVEVDPDVWRKFPKLQYLGLANTSLAVEQLRSIDRIATLRTIVVSPSQLSDELFAVASRMPSIELVEVEWMNEGDAWKARETADRWQVRGIRFSFNIPNADPRLLRDHIVDPAGNGIGKFLDPPTDY